MNVFEVVAKITLDAKDYDKKLNEESGKLKNLGSKLGNAAKVVGKASAAAIAAGATAIGALAKQAVSAYGEYEQLKGGVETLFGAQGMSMEEYAASVGKSTSEIKQEYQSMLQAQEEVLKNADEAYKTAGLSANEYMQTVTSFAASLNQSLGGDTQRAAKMADMAIKDMSDNANKMGTSMDSIQNAYQGFAKQNYTMLDNLKLGYGGTKSEMERLVEDAEKLNSSFKAQRDENGKLALSYADVIDAIHIVQDNMGVTGTTAKEAASTIQGSFSMMKSSWQNLIAGLGKDDADLDSLIDNFVTSLSTFGDNIFPIIEKSINGIGMLISELLPKLGERLPAILQSVLPNLLTAVTDLISAVVENLPSLISTAVPQIITALLTVFTTIAEQLPALLTSFIQAFVNAISSVADALPDIIPALVDMVTGIAEALIDNIDLIIDAAIKIVQGLAEGLVKAIPRLVEKVPTLITKLVNAITRNVPKIIKAGIELFTSLIKDLPAIIAGIVKAIPEIITAIITGFLELIPGLTGVFQDALDAVEAVFGVIVDFFSGIWDAITGVFGDADGWFGGIFGDAVDLITGVFGGIADFFSGIWDTIKGIFGGVADFFSSTFGAAASAVKAAFKDVTDTVDATSAGISIAAGAPIYRKKGSSAGMPSNIPQHADGGVFYRPTLGIFGEAGAEAVVPLDQNKKWIHAVAQDFAQQMSGMAVASGGSGDIIIPVYIGQNRIDEIVVSAQQRLNYRSGGRA